MSEWVAGVPAEEGEYWLKLAPTNKIGRRLMKYNMTCYAAVCGCHKSLINMSERDQTRIDNGFYTVAGFIKLPSGDD